MDGLIIDLFAGGGGASLGMEMALGRPVDIAINHNPEAVAIHQANHPTTRHFTQNICHVRPLDATSGQPVDVLWASPDCKHFSKAKGTAPKERNIRELGWAVVKWIQDTKPKLVCVENVEEFQTWGPIDSAGQPIKERAGETFKLWVQAIKKEGYQVEWRLLRACDFGAPTIRRRLFVVCRRDRKAIVWPEPTHGPNRANPWRTAAECIDWSIPVPSIFNRKKPLAENTLKRIAEGLRRFVIETDCPFIVPGQHTPWILQANTGLIGRAINQPLSTICQTGSHQQLLVASLSNPLDAAFLVKSNHTADYYNYFRGQDLSSTLQTITQSPGFSLATGTLVPFLAGVGGGKYAAKPTSLIKPTGVIVGENHRALVTANLSHFYGTMQDGNLLLPMKTVTAAGQHSALITAFLSTYYGQSIGSSILAPTCTATQKNKQGLVTAFLTKYYGHGGAHRPDVPLGTLTTRHRYGLVVVHQVPLVQVGTALYLITDIGLRMLTPRELARAQGFPDGYIFDVKHNGRTLSKKAQVSAIGNSVPPAFSQALVTANRAALEYRPAQPKISQGATLFEEANCGV